MSAAHHLTATQALSASSKRIAGLDGLRFLLALCVVIFHLGVPPLFSEQPGESLPHAAVRAAFGGIFNGPAAVAMFFLISGFCIHFPFRSGRKLPNVWIFYARRNVRIVAPALVAILLSPLAGVELSVFHGSILWSLVCEEIYYLSYPALRRIAGRLGWRPLLVLSALFSIVPILLRPGVLFISDFGWTLTWFVGLPYWLGGCLLAERWDQTEGARGSSRERLWLLRAAMLAMASGSSLLRFHSPVPYIWTVPALVALGYFWVAEEARSAAARGGSLMDPWGLFSYSTYLFHPFAAALLARWLAPDYATWAGWSFGIAATIAICYLLYLAVERPSHRLARSLFRFVQSKGEGAAALAMQTGD